MVNIALSELTHFSIDFFLSINIVRAFVDNFYAQLTYF